MWRILALAISLSVAMTGCGGSSGPPKAKLYPVTGKVTSGGKPLTDCSIVLSTTNPAPGASAGYSATLGPDGQYTLADPASGSPGAAVGKYKVTFVLAPEAAKKAMQAGPMTGPGYEAAAAPFPKEYAAADTSPKEVEVKAEANIINIEL
jgi:hypothetical protein